ncbi:FkbM family methyltransferase [Polynucleobacter sp. es-EL-1]|uniref:FkbM family methyltransferase n=1 Tax=Polynucleobacter sp. es-EL-1 TaxID=1855652 RepID=UPI001BFE7B0F|nr:FkbM family methyltransferase [Polynucleobacter sp. es-EL-1]QWE10886.1 FkbM family methyltransferase [Polynucleobacter sp. es-EL-1]
MKYTNRLDKELKHISNLIKDARVAIDVGANRGVYAFHLSKIFNEVIVFEPQKWCIDIIKDAEIKNIKLFNYGLSNTVGMTKIYTPLDPNKMPIDAFASLRPIENSIENIIPINRLDYYDFSNVDFIKIDVEGHEYEVLEGAIETLKRNKPLLLVEIEQRHQTRNIIEVFNFLSSIGYSGYWLNNLKLISIKNFSVENNQTPFLNNVNNSSYINNFFFLPI